MRTLTVLLAACLLLTVAVVGWCDDSQLTVVQDESSMEQSIARYLRHAHHLVVEEKTQAQDKGDVYLEVPPKDELSSKLRMTIDTQPLNRDKDNKVTERGILISLFTGVSVKKEEVAKVQTAINDFTRRRMFSSIFIDSDGELVCTWSLNVLSQGLPTEYVFDALARVANAWKMLYPELVAAAPPASPSVPN